MTRRTVSNFKRALGKGEGYFQRDRERLRRILNSYLGLMLHHKTFGSRKRIVGRNEWIFRYGRIDAGYRRFRYDGFKHGRFWGLTGIGPA